LTSWRDRGRRSASCRDCSTPAGHQQARIRRDQAGATDFTVAALVEELRAEFTGIAANKGLQLEIQGCDGSAHGDPALVEHILRNLIANAIQSTHEGGVRLHCLREAAFVRIEVLDTGVVGPAAGSDENCGLE